MSKNRGISKYLPLPHYAPNKMAACRRGSTLGQGAPNVSLAFPKCDIKHFLTNSKHRLIGAKGAFCGLQTMPKCVSGPRWRTYDDPQTHSRLGSGPRPPLHTHFTRRSILPPLALATGCLDNFWEGACPQIFFFKTVPGCMRRWARCPVCKTSNRFLPFWYCLTPPYKRKRGQPPHRVGHCQCCMMVTGWL